MSIVDFVHRALGKSKSAVEWAASHAGVDAKDHVWIKVNLDHPHVGISNISDAKNKPFDACIEVTGVNLEEAMRLFTGKVLDIGDELAISIKAGKATLDRTALSNLFR